MTKPGPTEYTNQTNRRTPGINDRWRVFKIPGTQRWATGPTSIGVYANLQLRRKYLTFNTLTEAGDYARKRTTP